MDLITIILTFAPAITAIGFLWFMWRVDAYPFHRAGRADPNARPPIPERHDHKKLSIDWRLSLLRNAGLCVLMVDDENPTEVMDKIPENFPYIIIYPSQSDSEKDAIVSYGEAMWKGWIDYYGTRKIPKWDDIKPFEPRWESERIAIANRALLNDPDACNGECSNVTMHGYCVNKDYSGNCSYKGRSLGGGRRCLVDKWAPVMESDIGGIIKSPKEARKYANIIESKPKLNDGYLLDPYYTHTEWDS